ncbi:MAG TPA: hypothetical protein VLE54_00270 [Thermoanaerobaculia bacterium]|nr:hypothetical protein [Thermoanaerobaculia bacterium]
MKEQVKKTWCGVFLLVVVGLDTAAGASARRIVAPTAGARLSLGVSTILTALESPGAPQAGFRCRWSIESAGQSSLSIPQDPGPRRDGFSTSNCSRNVRFGEIEGVHPGEWRLSLETLSSSAERAVTAEPERESIPITLVNRSFSAVGVAPAVAIPGEVFMTLYGEGFDRRTRLFLDGPVYSVESPQKPLCELAAGRCPRLRLVGWVGSGGTSFRFGLPSSVTPGLYRVAARRGLEQTTRWLTVEAPRKIVPPPGNAPHHRVLPIYSGQTIRGIFRPRGDSSGVFWDYDLFYFVATAGSVIDISLSRVDTAKSWLHPDEIDPEIYVAAPRGDVLADFWNGDVQPGSDFNARLAAARLSKSGLYLIVAATTKGAGEYELQFHNQPAPACGPRDQFASLVGAEPFSINLKYPFPSIAAMLDPHGRPLGDAPVNFRAVPPEGWRPEFPFEPGVGFVGGAGTRTNLRGLAAVRAFLDSEGTVDNAPFLPDTVLVASEQGENPAPSPHRTRGLVAALSYLVRQVDLLTGEISLEPYQFTKVNP